MYFIILIILFSFVNSYDIIQSQVCVMLSGSAYCDKTNYTTMIMKSPASNFELSTILYDKRTDLQGYIGIMKEHKTIYVVLRGSSSKLNWLNDFEVRLTPYNTYPECNCSVHTGFYNSALSIKYNTIIAIRKLQYIYSNYKIILTGHSYGASCSVLLALELVKKGFDVEIYNYGQPRIGDVTYALFANIMITKYWRFTHYKDIVPHLPPNTIIGYTHSCIEIYEDEKNKLNMCNNIDCEDINCSNQYLIKETNTKDHMIYLQHYLNCSNSIM